MVFGGEGAGLEMIVITGIRDGEHGVFKVSLGYAGLLYLQHCNAAHGESLSGNW